MKTVMMKLLLLLCIMIFCLKWKNIINMLLSLEVFMLLLMFFISIFLLDLSIFYLVIIILISEAVLGLSLLIMNIRFFGNDYSMNFFW